MIKEEKFVLDPLHAYMTYDENCWLCVNVSSSDSTKVIFYNPSQANMDDKFNKFKDFAEYMFEDNFKFAESKTDINSNKCTKIGYEILHDEDYDEESGRSWKVTIADVQIMDIYKNIKLEKIQNLIEETLKDLKISEQEYISNHAEDEELSKDPHGFYGVRKSDFY